LFDDDDRLGPGWSAVFCVRRRIEGASAPGYAYFAAPRLSGEKPIGCQAI